MIQNITDESISDSSDSEEEMTNWQRISKKPVMLDTIAMKKKSINSIAVPSSAPISKGSSNSNAPPSSSSSPFIKKERIIPIIEIEDSSGEDSDDSIKSTQSASGNDALAQLLTINQRHPKPKPLHPNLITRPYPSSVSSALPPRHPTLERNNGVEKGMDKQIAQQQQQHRVSPVSGMSSSSHQSAKQKALFLWRRRLWPSLAAFYRILLRCQCKYTPLLSSATASSTFATLQDVEQRQHEKFLEMQQGDIALEWGSFWDSASLAPLSVHFSSVAEHNRQLFLLLLEECRASMSTQITRQGYLSSNMTGGGKKSYQQASGSKEIKWQRGEVKMITANLRDSLSSLSPSGSSSLKVEPRLGSLWMLQVQLLPPKRNRSDSELSTASTSSTYEPNEKSRFSAAALNENNASVAYSRERSNSYSSGVEMIEGYRPGELLVCRNQLWGNRLALGVVQGYDPDYDMVLNSSSDDCQFTTLHVLLCVDTANANASKEPSGWVDPDNMPLCQGTILQLSVIGNMITSLRECQAISSLASLRPSLRELILCRPGKSYCKENACVHQETILNLSQEQRCPEGVSKSLWKALCGRFNKSQLLAMTSAVEVPRVASLALSSSSSSLSSTGPGLGQDKNLPPNAPYPLILLQGPPGTGKTSTIMGVISILLDVGVPSDSPQQQGKKIRVGSSLTGMAAKSITAKNAMNQKPPDPAAFAAAKTRILLCAPSNTAVDELVYRIKKYGILGSDGQAKRSLKVVRIGQPLNSTRATSSTEGEGAYVDVKEFTLDYLVDKKRREVESTQRSGYKRTFMPNTLQLRHQVLEQADIVCCTLSGSGSPQLLEAIINHGASGGKSGETLTSSGDGNNALPPFCFDVVIIDEAAQAIEPSALIPLKYNPKVLIMVGDACQLRATVLSKDASKCSFGRSLFERLDVAGYPKQMLQIQYRMHPDIACFPSKRFYGGKLINDSRMQSSRGKRGNKGSHWKPFHDDRSLQLRPLVFHNVNYGREEMSGSSYCNHAEAEYILNLVAFLWRQYPSSCPGGVGIITAYNGQKHLLKKMFKQQYGHGMGAGGSKGKESRVEIATIDGFQGREKDIIIFSCVRSSIHHAQDRSNIGFMDDNQRLNVALTRAKFGLWLVGDVRTMQASGRGKGSVWGDLVEHCRKRGFIYEPRSNQSGRDHK